MTGRKDPKKMKLLMLQGSDETASNGATTLFLGERKERMHLMVSIVLT